MKTEIITSEQITKELVVKELTHSVVNLTRDEINEYLDILTAINNDEVVFSIKTNKGEYLLYIKKETEKIDNKV